MLIAASLKGLLDRYNISYSVSVYTHLAKPLQIIIGEVLADSDGEILVVRPLNRPLDLRILNQILHRNLQPLPKIHVNRVFHDCEAGCWPPVGTTYALNTIIDASILKLDKVCFTSGSRTAFIKMQQQDYLDLLQRYRVLNCTFAEQAITELPLLPDLVTGNIADEFNKLPTDEQKILEIVANSGQAQAVALIKQDPLIIQPKSEFWQHAVAAANNAEHISRLIDPKLDSAVAYLTGLLQNFGLLLFSHLFPPEYRLLQKWLRINPRASIVQLEQRLLGMGRAFYIVRCGHAQLGAQLLHHYGLNTQLCTLVQEHHNRQYAGEWSIYIKIIQLTNQLLRRRGLGDGDPALDSQLLTDLGLTLEQLTVTIGNNA